MTEYAARRNPDRRPTHPGAILFEAIDATGMTRVAIADRLGISRQHLYDLLEERKPVSPVIAAKLGRLFGNGGGLWLRMQAAHDLWQAERTAEVDKVKTLELSSAD